VMEGAQGKIVYLLSPQSTAMPAPVTVGDWTGSDWIITSGLKAGDQVITDGVMKLGPGAPVRIAEKKEAEQQKPEQPKPAAKK
jgi:membrane fusion protein (multidrug efflux system)